MIRDYDIESLLEVLSSKSAVPGGGGASALAGAIGTALGQMTGSLTLGKKKYADVEEDIKRDMEDLEMFRDMFLRLADKDEEVFLPLSRAYGMPKETEQERAVKAAFMEQALYEATLVPLSVMETAEGALKVMRDMAEKGSRLAVSDTGVGTSYLRTALAGARYNCLINLKSMKDEARREALSRRCEAAMKLGNALADETESIVLGRL